MSPLQSEEPCKPSNENHFNDLDLELFGIGYRGTDFTLPWFVQLVQIFTIIISI